MSYQVLLTPRAVRDIRRLQPELQQRLLKAIAALGDNPRPQGCEKVRGSDEWRIRVGDYRVRYRIDDSQHQVIVTRIGHRNEIYDV
ncbi:MAG: type II toxin-antitoxin system mRNA interferase toxin, RelE/StbE family [Candidatus Fervidibacterota bacterium]